MDSLPCEVVFELLLLLTDKELFRFYQALSSDSDILQMVNRIFDDKRFWIHKLQKIGFSYLPTEEDIEWKKIYIFLSLPDVNRCQLYGIAVKKGYYWERKILVDNGVNLCEHTRMMGVDDFVIASNGKKIINDDCIYKKSGMRGVEVGSLSKNTVITDPNRYHLSLIGKLFVFTCITTLFISSIKR